MWPDKRLRTPVAPVAAIDEGHHALWTDMIDTMEAMPGVGLAAPQIGEMVALCVVDASDTRDAAIRMANPEIVRASEALRPHEEASPNLPGIWAKIERPAEVRVRFLGADGEMHEQDFSGLWATSVQHQIDHLAGRVYIDHLSKTKRAMLLKKLSKQKR